MTKHRKLASAATALLLLAATPASAGDFCTDLKMVVSQMPQRLASLKGRTLNTTQSYPPFLATLTLPGAEYCYINDTEDAAMYPSLEYSCVFPTSSTFKISDSKGPWPDNLDPRDAQLVEKVKQCIGGPFGHSEGYYLRDAPDHDQYVFQLATNPTGSFLFQLIEDDTAFDAAALDPVKRHGRRRTAFQYVFTISSVISRPRQD